MTKLRGHRVIVAQPEAQNSHGDASACELTGGPRRLQHAVVPQDPEDGDTVPDTDAPTPSGQTPGDSDISQVLVIVSPEREVAQVGPGGGMRGTVEVLLGVAHDEGGRPVRSEVSRPDEAQDQNFPGGPGLRGRRRRRRGHVAQPAA